MEGAIWKLFSDKIHYTPVFCPAEKNSIVIQSRCALIITVDGWSSKGNLYFLEQGPNPRLGDAAAAKLQCSASTLDFATRVCLLDYL